MPDLWVWAQLASGCCGNGCAARCKTCRPSRHGWTRWMTLRPTLRSFPTCEHSLSGMHACVIPGSPF